MAGKHEIKPQRGSGSSYAPELDEVSLEDILAEYGGSRSQRLLTQVEQDAANEPEKMPLNDVHHNPFPQPPKDEEGGKRLLFPVEPEANPFQDEEDEEEDVETDAVESDAVEGEDDLFAQHMGAGKRQAPPTQDQLSQKLYRALVPEDDDEPDRDDPLEEQGFTPEDFAKPKKEEPIVFTPLHTQSEVGAAVGGFLDEDVEPILQKRKRGLFSRRLQEETQPIFDEPAPPPPPEPEPDCSEQAVLWRRRVNRAYRTMPWAGLLVGLLPVVHYLEFYGIEIPYWAGDVTLQAMVTFGWLAVLGLLCSSVFAQALRQLMRGRISAEFLVALAVLVSMADCARVVMDLPRSDAPLYGMIAGVSLVVCAWGVRQSHRGNYEMFRTAALDENPPHLVTQTPWGAGKRQGKLDGFYTCAMKDSLATQAQAVLLPLVLVASIVCAVLASNGQERGYDLALNLSAILCASANASLVLAFGLPWGNLAAGLQRNGCTVAGYAGARAISRSRAMLVTDGDLFPTGTMALNGYKLFDEDLTRAASYAASITRRAGCGLAKMFDNLLRSESGSYYIVDDFAFCEEGGYRGKMDRQEVLLGTLSFMRQMDVAIPGGLNLKTGIFLAVEGRLSAVFAVKYQPSEHVDVALKMLRRNHIEATLVTRDPNVTPTLLHRKFGQRNRFAYPNLEERIDLSEEAGASDDVPHALLLRGGLLPYARTVVGCRRLCAATASSTAFGLFGSVLGLGLSFYLVFLESYTLLTPLALLFFTLLWVLPVAIRGASVKHF